MEGRWNDHFADDHVGVFSMYCARAIVGSRYRSVIKKKETGKPCLQRYDHVIEHHNMMLFY